MQVADMMQPKGRVFMKSEFGPVGDQWPCFSFTRKNVAAKLQADYRPGRDIIIYVGTTDSKTTEDPNHRSCLISAVSVEPNHILETRRIVPEDQWVVTIAQYGENPWPYSMAVTNAALMLGPPFPEARAFTPEAYASFARVENRGNVVEAVGAEREAVMKLPIEKIELHLTEPVRRYMRLMGAVAETVEKSIRQEALRLAVLIQQRVQSGGDMTLRQNPIRSAPNISDLVALIIRKWTEGQQGKCALCGGPLSQTVSGMLQASADRIDSSNPAYDDGNMQITHLACNWAKNKYGAEAFADWLTILRDVRPIEVARTAED